MSMRQMIQWSPLIVSFLLSISHRLNQFDYDCLRRMYYIVFHHRYNIYVNQQLDGCFPWIKTQSSSDSEGKQITIDTLNNFLPSVDRVTTLDFIMAMLRSIRVVIKAWYPVFVVTKWFMSCYRRWTFNKLSSIRENWWGKAIKTIQRMLHVFTTFNLSCFWWWYYSTNGVTI